MLGSKLCSFQRAICQLGTQLLFFQRALCQLGTWPGRDKTVLYSPTKKDLRMHTYNRHACGASKHKIAHVFGPLSYSSLSCNY
jgi:hypothetical protein